MVIEDLFKLIGQLNDIYKELKSPREFSLKFISQKDYDNLECYKETYTDMNKFIKNMEEESYFTDIDTSVVELLHTDYDIENSEFKVTFSGKITPSEPISQNVYIYIHSSYTD